MARTSGSSPVPPKGGSFDEHSFNPAWSPDSRNIVYVKSKGADADLWIMNADGSAKHQLTSGVAADLEPAWSPDGSRITFRRRSGQSTVLATVLANTGELVVYEVQPTFGATPSHSPDGKWLTYTATDDQRLGALMVLPGHHENGPRLVRGIETGGGSNAMWIRRP